MRIFRRRPADLPSEPLYAVLAPSTAQIVRNLMVTTSGALWAGYRLGAARWDFTSDEEKTMLLESSASIWSTLLGMDVHERVTTRPHPVLDWSRFLDARTSAPVDVSAWNELLARQRYRIFQAGMDDKIVYRYVRLGDVEPGTDVITAVLAQARFGTPLPQDLRPLMATERQVAQSVAGPGWNAVRMTERDAGWLRVRSLAPGLPAPLIDTDAWAQADMGMFASDVRWEETPFARHTLVRAWRDGKMLTRAVQVLTASRMSDLDYPCNGLEPWQAFAERVSDSANFAFPVEWSLNGHLSTGAELAHQAELDFAKAGYIRQAYLDHREVPPQYVERGIDVAALARDQITDGRPVKAGRFTGTVNMMVWADDERDEDGRVIREAAEILEERSNALRLLYSGPQMRMDFAVPLDQARRLREFVPGEPRDFLGYQRRMRLDYLSAGLPNVSATVGDSRGPYIGYTQGAARRPVMHDPHFATEGRGALGRGANLWIVAATLGGGKSVLLATILYLAALRGTRCVVRDPSGPLAALCRMPELADVAEEVNLLRGARGILNPPGLIREPSAEEFDTGDLIADLERHGEAAAEAAAERRALVVETAQRCLPWDLYSDKETISVLRMAADQVADHGEGWTTDSSLWDLIFWLEQDERHAKAVASALRSAAEMPILRLLFPPLDSGGGVLPAPVVGAGKKILTVITTPGIKRATDSTPRSDWSHRELAADVVLRLTTLFTDRLLYSKPMGERAVAAFDEAEDMTDTGPGRAYFDRLGRDHSKWNTAVYLGLKNVTDEMMGGEMKNFIAGAFVGQMSSSAPEAAEKMLSILQVADRRYARTLMGLSRQQPGEFVHLDAEGHVGVMKVDIDYLPDLHAVVLTDPQNEGSQGWALTEEAMV